VTFRETLDLITVVLSLVAAAAGVASLWFIIHDWKAKRFRLEISCRFSVPVSEVRGLAGLESGLGGSLAISLHHAERRDPDIPYFVVAVTKRSGPFLQAIRVYLDMMTDGEIIIREMPHSGPTTLGTNETHRYAVPHSEIDLTNTTIVVETNREPVRKRVEPSS
jgi:hypothetical protein